MDAETYPLLEAFLDGIAAALAAYEALQTTDAEADCFRQRREACLNEPEDIADISPLTDENLIRSETRRGSKISFESDGANELLVALRRCGRSE